MNIDILGVLIYAGMAYVTGIVLGLTICRRRNDDKMFEFVFSLLWPMTWIFLIIDYIATTVGRKVVSVLNPANLGRRLADWLDNRGKDKRKDKKERPTNEDCVH